MAKKNVKPKMKKTMKKANLPMRKLKVVRDDTVIDPINPLVKHKLVQPVKQEVLNDIEDFIDYNSPISSKTMTELRRLLDTEEASDYVHTPKAQWAFLGTTVTREWLQKMGVDLKKPGAVEHRVKFTYGNIPSVWSASEKLASKKFNERRSLDTSKVNVIFVAQTRGQNGFSFIEGPEGLYKLIGKKPGGKEFIAIQPIAISQIIVPEKMEDLKTTRTEMPAVASVITFRGQLYRRADDIGMMRIKKMLSAFKKTQTFPEGLTSQKFDEWKRLLKQEGKLEEFGAELESMRKQWLEDRHLNMLETYKKLERTEINPGWNKVARSLKTLAFKFPSLVKEGQNPVIALFEHLDSKDDRTREYALLQVKNLKRKLIAAIDADVAKMQEWLDSSESKWGDKVHEPFPAWNIAAQAIMHFLWVKKEFELPSKQAR